MRVCVQRVTSAQVVVDGAIVAQIERGLFVLLGVAADDTPEDALELADKVIALRVFEDTGGKMNLSLQEIGGSLLVVSQFTLLGDCRKGRRPSFTSAAPPEPADELYRRFVDRAQASGVPTVTGHFRAHMQVTLTNDGPVTLLLDSRKQF